MIGKFGLQKDHEGDKAIFRDCIELCRQGQLLSQSLSKIYYQQLERFKIGIPFIYSWQEKLAKEGSDRYRIY